MKSLLRFAQALLATGLAAVAAFAAEAASPAGTWKWSAGRGGQGIEQVLKLELAAGNLTGTLLGSQTPPLPDTPISEASFKDGVIKFAVVRELNGAKVATRYEGKLEGDSIKGTSERPNPQGGDPVKREWDAKRAK
jgi:hypothetical protein